ncbi:hypothetical protein QQ045_023367 [Rhodiola kirilowii]
MEGRSIMTVLAWLMTWFEIFTVKFMGGNILIKLDMSKAYDRLSWRFLLKMFSALGFSNKWIDLIYRNIANCWYSVVWNRKQYGFFKSNRGVRQGDPLSPTLFILAMEFFSRLLNNEISNNRIMAFQLHGCRNNVHHLLYADDLLIFTNGHKRSVQRLLETINVFCQVSGQQLNASKSRIFFSKHIGVDRRKSLLDLTHFQEGSFPTQYLGAPLFPGRARISYFRHLEDCIRSKVAGWAKNFLSISGRALLITSVLGSLSVHTLSIIPVPKGCLRQMESLLANFLWDGKHHWVNWEAVCVPKDEGGLGIKRLDDVKKAVLSKMAWKVLLNSSTWASFVRNKYLYKSRSSAIWSALIPLMCKLRRESCWVIGKGDTLLSHFCEWMDMRTPKEAAPWTINDVVNIPDIKIKVLAMLPPAGRVIINQLHLNDRPDKLIWTGNNSGTFSAKDYYLSIRKVSPKSTLFGNIWKAWIPPKVSGLVWKFFHQAVPTDDAVKRLGILLPSRCNCCVSPVNETANHLFIRSDVAKEGWKFLAIVFNKITPFTYRQLRAEWFLQSNPKNFMECLAFSLSCCALWEIWCYRNDRMHGKVSKNINRCLKR